MIGVLSPCSLVFGLTTKDYGLRTKHSGRRGGFEDRDSLRAGVELRFDADRNGGLLLRVAEDETGEDRLVEIDQNLVQEIRNRQVDLETRLRGRALGAGAPHDAGRLLQLAGELQLREHPGHAVRRFSRVL